MLPVMAQTIVIMLILRVSTLFRSSLDKSYLLGNVFNRDRSYVLEYYVVDMGLNLFRFSFATAVNLVQSVASLILLFIANSIANRVNQSGIF